MYIPLEMASTQGPITLTAQSTRIVKVGDKVMFHAQLSTENQRKSFLAVHECQASSYSNTGKMETLSLIKNG